MKSWQSWSSVPVETPGATWGAIMSRVSAASRPAARIPTKSSGAWIVMRLASVPPSMLVRSVYPPRAAGAGRAAVMPPRRKMRNRPAWRKGSAPAAAKVIPKGGAASGDGEVALVQHGMHHFRGWRGLQILVEIPLHLALRRGLHLEQIGGELAAPVGPDAALAEGVVVGRDRLHVRHGGAAALLGLCRPHRLRRLEIVQHDGVGAGVRLARVIVRRLRQHALGEGAGPVIEIPVERLARHQPLRGIEP